MAAKHKGRGTAGSGDKQQDVRSANITAAKAVADSIRTSLGPRGMDKMIVQEKGEVVITNDGATILKQLQLSHPCAKMLVELSKAQDVEAGDGTTSVVVLCGAMLKAAQHLLHRGIHPTDIQDAFTKGGLEAQKILAGMSTSIDIDDRDMLIKAAVTSLSSKVVSQNSTLLAPMAADAVRAIIKKDINNVDLNDIRVVTSLGGTMEDTELITDGMIFKQKAVQASGGLGRVQNAKTPSSSSSSPPRKPTWRCRWPSRTTRRSTGPSSRRRSTSSSCARRSRTRGATSSSSRRASSATR
eukprot:Sspe_Gene.302::Locus_102_Transcript_1_3_Confidence_0.714_Length_1727::g.302::m.302/K09496/CCT4; T-complex protein 1 subunit delta